MATGGKTETFKVAERCQVLCLRHRFPSTSPHGRPEEPGDENRQDAHPLAPAIFWPTTARRLKLGGPKQ